MNGSKKKSAFKSFLKWFSIAFLALLLVLVLSPFLFKNKIKSIVENTINKSINATVSFHEINLSLLKSFPLAQLSFNEVLVINKAPFLGDTLFYGKEVNLKMQIMELFKSEQESMNLQHFSVSEGQISLLINKEGKGNYEILKEKTSIEDTGEVSPLSLQIQNYEVADIDFSYFDQESKMNVSIDRLFHSGKGSFSKGILDLNTKSHANFSIAVNGVHYMKNVAISLDAIIGMDVENNKYSFKENAGFINQLPLEFNGFIQFIENGQLYDLNFKTPTSSFKNVLALVPVQYAGNLNSVKTEGDFTVNGIVKGIYSNKTIPAFDISLISSNAQFKYADLPKSVKNIYINAKIINSTGILNDTYIHVDNLSFLIDQDVFNAKGNIYNIAKNPRVTMSMNGSVNLENISKVYPISLDKKLTGILKADVTSSFDMNAIEKGNYQEIRNSGKLSLSNFKYEGIEVAYTVLIDKASITFNPAAIRLNEFNAKTGSSDLNITGNLDNFYAFLFKDQVLKGNFILHSNLLKISDFMDVGVKKTENENNSFLKIPSFLECSITANASKVIYDNLHLENVSGNIKIKDEALLLQNLKMGVFGGSIAMNGEISTKEVISKFNMDLHLTAINISESFTQLDLLKSIAPIASTIEGKINSTFHISGDLTQAMTPDLKSISGDLMGQLRNTTVKSSNSKVLSALENQFNFIDLGKLNLNEASAYFTFENGQVKLKPYHLNYKDIGIEISGTHSFDQLMNYMVKFEVPAHYLGAQVTNYMALLTPKVTDNLKSIPISTLITGTFSNPSVKTDLAKATSTLIADLVEEQKKSLINEGKDKLNNLLNSTQKDSINVKKEAKDQVRNVLEGLFKKKKKNN